MGADQAGMSITEWQRRFFAAARVWMVVSRDGEPSNFYDSRESAEIELAWRKAHGMRGYSLASHPMHTVELSRERWKEES